MDLVVASVPGKPDVVRPWALATAAPVAVSVTPRRQARGFRLL